MPCVTLITYKQMIVPQVRKQLPIAAKVGPAFSPVACTLLSSLEIVSFFKLNLLSIFTFFMMLDFKIMPTISEDFGISSNPTIAHLIGL